MKRITEFEKDRMDLKNMAKLTGGQSIITTGQRIERILTGARDGCPNGDVEVKIYTEYTVTFMGVTHVVEKLTEYYNDCIE